MSAEVLALVNYYARSGYYRHMQTICDEMLKKRTGGSVDPTISFWRCVGMMLEGSVNEAIRELDGLSRRGDMALPVKVTLLYAHQRSKVVDTEEVARLEADLPREDDNATDRARLHTALVLWHLGEIHQARRQTQALLRLNPQHVQALCLSGQLALADASAEVEANGDPSVHLDSAGNAFDQAMAASAAKKDLETLMGKARLYVAREQLKEALECLNQVVVLYAWFLPALVEKFRVLVAMKDWEQATETAQRVLSQDAQNIEALRLVILFQLSQEARYSVACNRISDLADALDRHEPNNAPLYHKVAQTFARLAGSNLTVLQLTLSLATKACKIAPTKAEYVAEMGYQQMLVGDLNGATSTLKQAAALEDGATEVMAHMIKCQILQGMLDDAEQQLEFVMEIQASMERTPEMSLNAALLSWQRRHSVEESVRHLDEAFDLHMRVVDRMPFSEQYFVKLDPVMMLEIGREYLRHCGPEPEVHEEMSQQALILGKATQLLQLVVSKAPGLLEGQMALARARFLRCDFEGALRCCVACTKADPTFSAAALLHGQILLRQDKYKQAHGVLEQALSHNFSVRDSPLFHLVKAKVLQTQGEYAEALEVLQGAMMLPGITTNEASGRRAGTTSLSSFDRCAVFVQLIEVQLLLEDIKAAQATVKKAIFEFAGGAQEGRVTIANAKVELARGKVEKAIKMLNMIPADSSNYHAARSELADVYLTRRNDRHAYAACHEDLVKGNPTPQAYVKLGEAYMQISEPDKAIAAFENALLKSPGDGDLASRIGKVLVATHDYKRAVAYYSEALDKDPMRTSLRYELAELYLELGRYDQSQAEIVHLVGTSDPNEKTVDELDVHVKALLLQARVFKEQDMMADALEACVKAKQVQANMLARVRIESADQLPAQRTIASEIAFTMAEYQELLREPDAAIESYKECLKFDEANVRAMLALARLLLNRGDLEDAQSQTVSAMRADDSSEDASLMLANIMLQKNEWEAAIYHFERKLEEAPAMFKTLAKLLQLLRRAGRLAEADKFLKAAAKSSPRAPLEPGYKYCEGLLHKYRNDPRAALTSLNLARRDGEWGEQAVTLMIEIYLNPENETNWDELELDINPASDPGDAVRAAETLLRELTRSPRREVLAAYTLMAYKCKGHLERACGNLIELLNVEREYVPALVCLSQAYLMLKQAPKARNHLKRIAKMQFVAEMVDEFERGWLMLSDVYINGGKYDLAEELCKRCLQSNKSCAKAWEFLGVVKEKEMSYRDAASHYENAWKFENEASAAVGYKLSFNYLKAKKYVDAIDVCHKVLKQYPDYPRIKKEVLEKARQAMRT